MQPCNATAVRVGAGAFVGVMAPRRHPPLPSCLRRRLPLEERQASRDPLGTGRQLPAGPQLEGKRHRLNGRPQRQRLRQRDCQPAWVALGHGRLRAAGMETVQYVGCACCLAAQGMRVGLAHDTWQDTGAGATIQQQHCHSTLAAGIWAVLNAGAITRDSGLTSQSSCSVGRGLLISY